MFNSFKLSLNCDIKNTVYAIMNNTVLNDIFISIWTSIKNIINQITSAIISNLEFSSHFLLDKVT